jgi:tRNA threonylcarbamoyladenosine biosynthesis protein TsaE
MDGKFITKNSNQTLELGKKFAGQLKPGDALLLTGNLGAGKTTFVQGVAKGLGITDRILSPTFVLQRLHHVKAGEVKMLNHIDLYRLQGKQAIDTLGLAETINEKDNLTIIEWADRLSNFTPRQGYNLKFEYLGENKRQINIEKI